MIEEIRIEDLIKTMTRRLWFIGVTIGVFILLGVIHFLTTPKEYIATIKLLPILEQSNRMPGNLGNLAGLAGIDINTANSSTIPPSLYPDIIGSTPFSLELMYNEFLYDNDSIFLIDYFRENVEVSLFSKIKKFPAQVIGGLFRGSNSAPAQINTDNDVIPNFDRQSNLSLNPQEMGAKSQITSRVSAEVDKLNGTLNIQVKMQDGVLSSQVANFTQEYLTKYISEYKSGRESTNLVFAEARLHEAKLNYKRAQENLANFEDRNRNVSMALVNIKREELQNELSILFNVYNNLAQEVEQSKIRVQREMPAFKILEPAIIPHKESSPKLMLNIIMFGFLGAIISIIYVFISKPKED